MAQCGARLEFSLPLSLPFPMTARPQPLFMCVLSLSKKREKMV